MDNDKKSAISRRDFIARLWGFVVALPFLYGALKFISPPPKRFQKNPQNLADLDRESMVLRADDFDIHSSKIIVLQGEPVIVLRKSENEFSAFSAVCTHMNCTVGFRDDHNDIYCACHGGRYDLDGNVIEGPPKTPLTRFKVARDNGIIIIRQFERP